MGGRGMSVRRPLPPMRSRTPVGREVVEGTPTNGEAPAAEPAAEPTIQEAVAAQVRRDQLKLDQDEFGFGELESRGHFEKTDRNLFDGQDLDVPTYLRKGIKITL
jgi:cell division protein FtsZ